MNARTQPPIPGQNRRNHARALLRWLILAPLLLITTSLCAAIATARAAHPPGVDTTSQLVADYRPWEAVAFAPVQPGILAAIARDLGLSGVPGVVSLGGCFLPDADCGLASETPTASPTRLAATAIAGSGVAHTPTSVPGGTGSGPILRPTNTRTAALPTATPTPTPTPTSTSTPTSTFTPNPTNTATPTPTPTATQTSTNTPVPSPTFTATNTPCGNCEPDIGTPDGQFETIPDGSTLIFNLSSPIIVDGDPDWDLAYYERRDMSGGEAHILLDLVVLRIGINATGEWFVVFNWGNMAPGDNGSVTVPEQPNAYIPMSTLYGTPPYNTGILINVDTAAPTGVYDRLSITGPTPGPGTPAYGPGDRAEVDAVQVLPTPTPGP